MPNILDYELEKTPDEPPPPRRSTGWWVLGVLLIVAPAIAAYLAFGHRPASPAPAVERARPAQPSDRPLGGEAVPITLPPLNETDALVRELVKKISSHPRVAAWLATDDLIRS